MPYETRTQGDPTQGPRKNEPPRILASLGPDPSGPESRSAYSMKREQNKNRKSGEADPGGSIFKRWKWVSFRALTTEVPPVAFRRASSASLLQESVGWRIISGRDGALVGVPEEVSQR